MTGTAKTQGSEAALIEAAQLACQALDAAPHPYAIVRLDGECVAANRTLDSWARPAGLQGKLVGASLLLGDEGELAGALARVSLGEPASLDTDRLPLVAERRGRFRIHLAPFRVGSMICGAAVTFQDLTEQQLTAEALKAGERRFRLLVDSAEDGIGVHRGGILLYVNPAAVRMLGCDSAGEVIGRPIMDFVHPDHHDRVRSHIGELVHAGAAPIREETFVRKDGTSVMVEVSASRAMLDDGVADFVFFRDVTERCRQQAELDRAGRMESLGRFAGSVAHDFSNLLAGVQDQLAVARMQAEQPDALANALGAAEKEIERAAELTQQLSTFSRGADAPAASIDPNRVVEEAAGVVGRLGDGGERIEIELDRELGRVWMGAPQLGQVVYNLLLNAREAVSAGGSIRVGTRQRTIQPREAWPPERAGSWVVVSVRDTGVGMDSATRARIFEPFFSTKRCGQGAGLGLSTAYGLVKQAGGWIDVESEYGKGTTFEVHLPLQEDESVRAESKSAPSRQAGRETVLVCDDEERLAVLTAGLLDQYGYGAVTVANCKETLSALGRGDPPCDVVLLDVNLPDGSAQGVLEQMRSGGNRQPVILTSGYAEEDVPAELTSDQQVAGYLAKPYSVDRLVETIRRALSERRGRA